MAKILLVDDQPARLLSYRAILEPLGEELVEARSGTDALARLIDDEFAVILLDVNMPGMDGFETAAMIHDHPRFEHTPIIFVTAVNVTDLDRLQGYELGAVDYVTVPVVPEILRGKVMVLTELFRKRRELERVNAELEAANRALEIERRREVGTLTDSLRRANEELVAANASLQAEIAERRVVEQRFRFLADTVPSIIWTTAPDGTLTWGNGLWRDYYGFEEHGSPEQLIPRIIHPEEADEIGQRVKARLASGDNIEFEARHRAADGSYRWHITRAVPWRDESGRVLSWFGVTADIHAQKLLEERLREADRRKDEFLATLAHELRNPLAPIQNALHALRMAPEHVQRDRLQAVMERQMQLLVRMVEDLLDVSRVSRGKLVLRTQTVSLTQVLAVAVETVRPHIEQSRHRLEVAAPERDCVLNGDPQRLAQVFANLLSNACKYTEPGGRLWLAAESIGGQVRVSVRDTGIGLSAEQLQRVFDLFAQVDVSLERSRGGLGIGLTLARQLVEMHGGRLEATSEGLGRGCEFVVWLPLAAEAATISPPEHAAAPARSGMLRVLVVDDNRDGADTLALSIDMLGHQVLALYDPHDALARGEAFAPDLAFFDVGMPGLNGFELAERVRALHWGQHPLLVALTGWGQDADRRRSAQAGFDAHVVKPIDLATIEQICHRACDRIRARSAAEA